MTRTSSSALDRLATLSQEKTELLKRLINKDLEGAGCIEHVPRGAGNRVPASAAQQRMWFIEQFAASGSAYYVPIAWRLEGPLDEGVLQRALDHLVMRHG